ncbi:MAG: MarR family transcriptional regulator [Rhizobium sp.]|uniref:MarR family winged helix-turn-helix transcriptional regulator n=1 Tax=Rhizobium sp. SYY.PMSO TaxID=3382192 RepID=UPI000DDB4CC8
MLDKPNPEFAGRRLGTLIGLAARQWRRAVDLRLQSFNLTEATWLPLLRLAQADGPMRQKDLAAILTLDTSSVVRILNNLDAAGLIEQREDLEDRRAKAIEITEAGRTLVRQVETVSQDVEGEVLKGMPPSDLAATRRVLEQVCQALILSNDGSHRS